MLPSTISIAVPIDVWKYLATIWFTISVPPVVNPILNVNPYPIPLITPATIATSNKSDESITIYSDILLVNVTNNGNNIVPITEPIDVLTPSNGKLIISNATHSIVISKLGFIMLLKILAIPSTSPATILFVFKNRLYAKAYKNNPTDNVKYLLISCLHFITTPHP